MQATVIDAQIEQELEPQIRLWSIADYHQMIVNVGCVSVSVTHKFWTFDKVALHFINAPYKIGDRTLKLAIAH